MADSRLLDFGYRTLDLLRMQVITTLGIRAVIRLRDENSPVLTTAFQSGVSLAVDGPYVKSLTRRHRHSSAMRWHPSTIAFTSPSVIRPHLRQHSYYLGILVGSDAPWSCPCPVLLSFVHDVRVVGPITTEKKPRRVPGFALQSDAACEFGKATVKTRTSPRPSVP